MTITERIGSIIRQRGIMQKTIAEVLNVTPSTVNSWFKQNNTSIPSAYIMPLCNFFQMSPEELLEGTEPKHPMPNAPTQMKLTDNETKLLEVFRALDDDGQYEVIHAAIVEKRKQVALGIEPAGACEA